MRRGWKVTPLAAKVALMSVRVPAILVALLPLAACATADGDFPSLAIRDTERVSGEMQPAPPAYVPPPPSATAVDRIEGLALEARDADRAFAQEAAAARSAVAAAGSTRPGSESWARAQVALAGLEASRSRAMIALADLDRLYVDAALDNAELTRIETVRQEVAGQVEVQNAMIDGLLAGLQP